jgi:hypothetical protein
VRWWAAQAGGGPLAADGDDPAVAGGSGEERRHKLEAQQARARDGLDMFAEQARKHHSL